MPNLRILADESRRYSEADVFVRRAEFPTQPVLNFDRVPNRIKGTSGSFLIFRSKVPGGWLVAMRPSDSITFVPDPQHEWDGGSD